MRFFPVAVALLLAGQAVAKDIGVSDFAYASELSEEGYEPFATSGAGNALFGMKRDTDLYLCFLADEPAASAQRQGVLVAEVNGTNPDREVPNIPVVCVLTQ
ncbi:MAG: hypothetical protein ACKVKF_20510 [Rhodobacterales bacterium]